jgi:hypothetical protein
LELALLKNILIRFSAFFVLALLVTGANAQEDLSAHWDGKWIVDGTLFSIAVEVENEELKLTQVESLGFEWSNENGKIEGNIVTVEIEYAGVTGTIQAELVNPSTAVAFAATCLPDFMVVCLLSKDRQAVFRKLADQAEN